MGARPIVWSIGKPGGGNSADDVWIGGRSDPNSTTDHTRGSSPKSEAFLVRLTPIGTDQAGSNFFVTGGLSTGRRRRWRLRINTANTGGSSATPNSGVTRWLVKGATGHLFANLDNTYDIGAREPVGQETST